MFFAINKSRSRVQAVLFGLVLFITFGVAHAAAWEPKNPVEFVVPAGTGGGSDILARFIASLVEKCKLSPRPLVVVNKPGGGGAEHVLTNMHVGDGGLYEWHGVMHSSVTT